MLAGEEVNAFAGAEQLAKRLRRPRAAFGTEGTNDGLRTRPAFEEKVYLEAAALPDARRQSYDVSGRKRARSCALFEAALKTLDVRARKLARCKPHMRRCEEARSLVPLPAPPAFGSASRRDRVDEVEATAGVWRARSRHRASRGAAADAVCRSGAADASADARCDDDRMRALPPAVRTYGAYEARFAEVQRVASPRRRAAPRRRARGAGGDWVS